MNISFHYPIMSIFNLKFEGRKVSYDISVTLEQSMEWQDEHKTKKN